MHLTFQPTRAKEADAMDIGSVLVGLTKALAWPVALVVVVFALKGQLVEWLPSPSYSHA